MDAREGHKLANHHAGVAANEGKLIRQIAPPPYSLDGREAPAALERGAPQHMVVFHRGYMCIVENKCEQAVAYLRQAVELKPDFAEAHFGLGCLFHEYGRWLEAVAAYGEVIKIKPDFADVHYKLGLVHGENGKLPAAAAAFRRSIKIKPDFAEAHFRLGWILEKSGKMPEAIVAYDRAIELKPDFFEAYPRLGRVVSIDIDITSSKSKAVRDPKAELIKKTLTSAFAKAHYRFRTEAHYRIGAALTDSKRLPEAITAFRKCCALPGCACRRRRKMLIIAQHGVSTVRYSRNSLAASGLNAMRIC
jgi:tetratricopeptide (TPR) repeat protein